MTGGFSFNAMCFLCGEAVTGSKDMRKIVLGEDFDQKIKDFTRKRGFDDWAGTVQGRLDTIADLFSADAVCHLNCHSRFKQKFLHTPF